MRGKDFLFWGIVLGMFGCMIALRGQVPEQKVTAVSGQEIINGDLADKHVQWNGTVTKVTRKYTGLKVVTLETDDGWTGSAMIPPTVEVSVPPVGTRVCVQGELADEGMTRIDSREGLRILSPRISQYPYTQYLPSVPVGKTYRSHGKLHRVSTHGDGSFELTIGCEAGLIDAHARAGVQDFRDNEVYPFLFYRANGKIIVIEINP